MTDFLRGVTQENVESFQPVFQFNDSAMSAIPDAVKGSAGTIYWVQIDNSLNQNSCVLQLFNATAGSVVVGSTAADEVVTAPAGIFQQIPKMVLDRSGILIKLVGIFDYFSIPGSSITTVTYLTGASPGKSFTTAITAACTTSLVGATSPAENVSVTICYQ